MNSERLGFAMLHLESLGLSLWNLGSEAPRPFELRINNDVFLRFSNAEDAVNYVIFLAKNKGEA
tara:strand:- start:30 stop:221 length:192 start_codon:yes stop_codon:yes gene_type:complete